MSRAVDPALDPGVLATLRQLNEPGHPDVLQEVLRLFLSDAPARLTSITAAIDRKDAAALERAAHTLKGAAGSIGATALQRACKEMEELGRRRAVDAADAELATLRREYDRVAAEIDQLL